ncbi:MAG: polyribonucleotide nucleotidyltransferase, partial [Candidatus Omnitrophica bacterium]|nr:polyribonucleotide nucleotidyltransferase [Candidatus Omnitrophota bacterium]
MHKVSCEIGGKTLTLETGRMAKQAHGSVLVSYGETVILAAAVAAPEIKPGQDFFPLTVDYRERTYAAGKIPGGFFKREGRPTEKEILTSRLIDRPIRSLFHKDFLNEVALTLVVVSSDCENDTDIPAMIGAAAALLISDIPFEANMAAVRVGLIEGEFVANPTFEQMHTSDLDLVLAGVGDKVVMIEAGAKEITEEKMMEAIKFGQGVMAQVSKLLADLAKVAGKPKKSIVPAETCDEVTNKVKAAVKGEFEKVFDLKSKEAREAGIANLFKDKVLSQFDQEADDFCKLAVKAAYEKEEKKYVREMILGQDRRPDGRKEREIRPITCETSILPRTHGSALFTRGQTQSLSIATLGSGDDQQRVDALEGEQSKSFMLHYNFPSFSVGETKASRGPGRREIGHGALAERALAPIIPDQESFPYTIRLVSDILESNGSSSMATVCGGTLSLMDAGVPIKAPVAGIALGLVTDETNRWKVLTDIAGIEDHLGDMDFKAAGTRKG